MEKLVTTSVLKVYCFLTIIVIFGRHGAYLAIHCDGSESGGGVGSPGHIAQRVVKVKGVQWLAAE